MNITPILKDLKLHGGTLYTFPSASRDLNRGFSNSEYEFAFSNFACLNLPDFRKGEIDNVINGVYLEDLKSDSIDVIGDLNKSLKWHLQSYVMNFEVAVLNEVYLDLGRYDKEILRTPSEGIFFNWLQKIGAIKIENGREIFDNKTVQYIGNIDMVNNVNVDFDSFNEVYLNIPAGAGRSDEVYFNNVFSDIYGENGNGTINLESENIIGRDPDKLGMSDDITLKAIYDKGEDSDVEQHYDINKNIGYCINFNGNIDQMNFDSNDNFEFNCVLIYYRIRKGGGEWCTNLYGVLFLEEIKEISDGDNGVIGYIQRYPKFKNGNSWGLKIDLKIDTQPDSQMVMRDIEYTNPNDGSGMQMFSEALIQLDGCVKLFYEVKKENTDIEERLYTLENILSGVDEVNNLSNDVNILRTRVEMFQPSIDSLGERLSSIESRISKLETNLGYLINELKK